MPGRLSILSCNPVFQTGSSRLNTPFPGLHPGRYRGGTRCAVPLLLLFLVGCIHFSDGTTSNQPVAVDRTQWYVLYTRSQWDGTAMVDVRAVGDIMPGRFVAEVAAERGFDYLFAAVAPLLAGDLLIGNLESPLTERREPLRPGPYRMLSPPDAGLALRRAGFHVLALANNHALDGGTPGLQDTVATLVANDIVPLGVGADQAAAYAPVITDTGGLRLALLAFNDIADPHDCDGQVQRVARDFACTADEWGRAWLDGAALTAVQEAGAQADLVLVQVHWGHEYLPQPTPRQRRWAHDLMRAGADLIIGTHPHVLQPMTVLELPSLPVSGERPGESAGEPGRPGVVAYSLGNFVFDQDFSAETSTGTVLRVLLDAEGMALVAAAPVEIVAGQPRPLALDSERSRQALRALGAEMVVLQPTVPASTGVPPYASTSTTATVTGQDSGDTPCWQAWHWDGELAHPVAVPPDFAVPERPDAQRLHADLRGDGQPLLVTRNHAGLVAVYDGHTETASVVWQNEADDWYVQHIVSGDPNRDGRVEVLLLLWKPDADGVLRSHPFLVGWRGGRYRVIWGGSATPLPMQDLAVGDVNGDGWAELVVLEGGHVPGDRAETVSVWRWHGWGFQLEWRCLLRARGPRSGSASRDTLALHDITGDGALEILVGTTCIARR